MTIGENIRRVYHRETGNETIEDKLNDFVKGCKEIWNDIKTIKIKDIKEGIGVFLMLWRK